VSYRTLQWLVPGIALAHNLEEALTMRFYAPLVREHFARVAPTAVLAATKDLSWFYVALTVATVIPFLLTLAATRVAPVKGAAGWAVVVVQSIFLINVFVPHVPAAVALGGYAPGVATALTLELPFSLYFLRRSVREGVVSAQGLAAAIGVAAVILVGGLAALYAVAAHA